MTSDDIRLLPEALVLGVPEIDAEHAEMFARIASIKAHCLETNSLPFDEAEALLAFLNKHFAMEYELAARYDIRFADHDAKHRNTAARITRGIAEVSNGRQNVFSLLRFLEYWFERHILEDDKSLAEAVLRLENARRHSAQARVEANPARVTG